MNVEPQSLTPFEGRALDKLASTSGPRIIEGEWIARRPKPRGIWILWLNSTLKFAIACGLGWLFYQVPTVIFPDPLQNWKNPIVVFALICFLGKTMLETFFYDHFQP